MIDLTLAEAMETIRELQEVGERHRHLIAHLRMALRTAETERDALRRQVDDARPPWADRGWAPPIL